MAEQPPNPFDVKILPPDQSLQRKLAGTRLDSVFTPQAIKNAQDAIGRSSVELLGESLAHLRELEKAAGQLTVAGVSLNLAKQMIAETFALKQKAALAGYDLVATIADSLLSRCEKLESGGGLSEGVQIIHWHIEAMKQMLALDVKGKGGEVGEAILRELARLKKPFVDNRPL